MENRDYGEKEEVMKGLGEIPKWKNLATASHPIQHQYIYEAWQADRKRLGIPDDVKLFIEWAENKGFFLGVYLVGDDEASLWAEIHELRAISGNHSDKDSDQETWGFWRDTIGGGAKHE